MNKAILRELKKIGINVRLGECRFKKCGFIAMV